MSYTSSSSSLAYSSPFASSCGSSGSISQPETIPVNNSDDSDPTQEMVSLRTTCAWGILHSLNPKLYKHVHLETDEIYSFGRDKCCTITFEKNLFDEAKEEDAYHNISKKHFEIYKVVDSSDIEFSVYLKNLSSNPTFVNGRCVAQNHSTLLMNCAVISINKRANEVFNFVNVRVMLNEYNSLPSEFRKKYDLERGKLGSGATGVVRSGRCKKTDRRLAIKIITKHTSLEVIKDWTYEAKLMQRLDHPNIVDLLDVFDTDDTIYIVLELMKGDLCNYIMKNGAIQQNIAKLKFHNLLNAVSYLHSQKVIHRDLKPENILISQEDIESSVLKITDFGLSRLCTEKSMMRTICGTPAYIAPEILDAQTIGYTSAVDVWSLGCILFIMLSGTHPFTIHRKDITLEQAIRTGNFNFFNPLWENISETAKKLIQSMITVDPKIRVNLSDACTSEWFTSNQAELRIGQKKRKIENTAFDV